MNEQSFTIDTDVIVSVLAVLVFLIGFTACVYSIYSNAEEIDPDDEL